ncbi:J domain-containing protein [Candidatus Nitrospira salsa]
MNTISIRQALELFELPQTINQDRLNERYRKLLHTWHPNRYASLTNNPKKYMEMYKKGEDKTKEIHSAYQVLKDWLHNEEKSAP